MEAATPFIEWVASLGLPAQVALSAAALTALYIAYREATKAMVKSRNQPPIDLGLPLLGRTLDMTGDPWKIMRGKSGLFQTNIYSYSNITIVQSGELRFRGMRFEMTGDPWKITRGKSGLFQTNIYSYSNITIVQSGEDSEKIYRGEGKQINYWFPDHVKRIFGPRAVICISGDVHKRLRGTLISCFQPSTLRLTSEPIQRISRSALDSWEKAGAFDAGKEPFKVAFGVGTSFVGLDILEMPVERQEHLMQKTIEMNLGITSYPIDLGRWSTYGRGVIASDEMRTVMADVIKERRDLVRQLDAAGKPRPDDVLQKLLQLKDDKGLPLTDTVLEENMCLFIFASFETTASTLTSFLTCLCRHPEVQDRAYEEIKAVLGEDSEEFRGTKPIHTDRWNEFEYIDQVMAEAERMIPPIANSSWRETNTDYKLGGFNFKKGMRFLINSLERTRDPMYWKRPDNFEPERFGPERMEHKKGLGRNNKLNTFGGGSRQCLGKPLANYERKIFAVLALRDYKFSFIGEEPPMDYNLTLRIRTDYPMRITRRR